MDAAEAKAFDLPFDGAIEYFRDKVSLPTEAWDDLWGGMHGRAWVVAGATKDDLLSDLRDAVDKAISDGTTLDDFRKSFDAIVQKHGWSHTGPAGWRSAVIFNTNLSTAYHAAHWQQMTDPDVLQVRPYFRYVESSSTEPRVEHEQWYNLVLPADDPFWATHAPPNGWGCKCGLVSVSGRELERLKKDFAGSEYPIQTTAPEITYYDWVNKKTGEVLKVPNGIDPGWDHNPGETAWGWQLSDEVMAEWRAKGPDAWERLTQGDWRSNGLPEKLALSKPKAQLAIDPDRTLTGMKAQLESLLGGKQKAFGFETEGFRHQVLVVAQTLANHIEPARAQYLPLLPEFLTEPDEVWLSFERHKGTGRVALRSRIVKAVDLGKKGGLLLVAEARKGFLESWTFIPVRNWKYLNKQRVGKLVWRR